MNERISEIHRKHHRACLALARDLAATDRLPHVGAGEVRPLLLRHAAHHRRVIDMATTTTPTAKQYEFGVTNKRTGARDQVRATAYNQIAAYFAIRHAYGDGYEISDFPIATRPAHYVAGEIDCL